MSDKVFKYLRGFRIVRTVIFVISYIFTILGTSVAIIAASAVFLIILPLICVFFIGFTALMLSQRKRVCRQLAHKLCGNTAFIIFPDKNHTHNSFMSKMAFEHASREKCISIIVSPFFISSRGVTPKKYLSVREESNNVITIRRFVFFYLRKTVLKAKNIRAVLYY